MMEKESTQTNNEQTLSTNDSTEAVDKNVPYDRFSEVNTQKNDALKQVDSLQAQLDKMNQANKTKQEEELAKQGEYKQLLDNTKKELEGFKTKAEAKIAAIDAVSRITSIDDVGVKKFNELI